MDNMDYVDIFFTFLWTIWTLWTLRYSMDNSALDCESRCCGFTRKGHFATNYLTFVRYKATESEVPSSTAAAVDSGRQPP